MSETAFKTRHTFNLNLEFDVAHAVLIEVRDAAIYTFMFYSGASQQVKFKVGLYRACGAKHRRRVDGFYSGKCFFQSFKCHDVKKPELHPYCVGQFESAFLQFFDNLFRLVYIDYVRGFDAERTAHKIKWFACRCDVDISVYDPAGSIIYVGISASVMA